MSGAPRPGAASFQRCGRANRVGDGVHGDATFGDARR